MEESLNADLQHEALNIRQSHSICIFCPPLRRYKTNIMRNMMIHVFKTHPDFRHVGLNRLSKSADFARSELEISCASEEQEEKGNQTNEDYHDEVEDVDIDELIKFYESNIGPWDTSRSLAIVEHLEVPNPDDEFNFEVSDDDTDFSPKEIESPSKELERILYEDIANRQCYVHLVKILTRRPPRVLSFS